MKPVAAFLDPFAPFLPPSTRGGRADGSFDFLPAPRRPAGGGGGAPTPLYHVLVIGQSNAVGSSGPILSTTTPTYSPVPQMFSAGVRPGGTSGGGLGSLVPLVESEGSETVCSGFARRMHDLYPDAQFLMSISARSGQPYSGIKKGTAAYSESIEQVTAAKSIADAAGRPYRVLALVCIHGESDQQLSVANYNTNLIEWQSDYDGDIKGVTGQSELIPLFACQQISSSPTEGGAQPAPNYIYGTAQKLYQAWKAQPTKVVLIGSRYMYMGQDTNGQSIHFRGYAQRWHGQRFADAVYQRCVVGSDWKPLTPVAGGITRSGTTLTVNLNVPYPPVRLAYDYVGRVPGGAGFTFYDDSGSPPTVTSVTVSGPSQLTLTLSGVPTGTPASFLLRYAFGSTQGPFSGTTRGNICDSNVAVSPIDGLPLNNWMAIFEEAVT